MCSIDRFVGSFMCSVDRLVCQVAGLRSHSPMSQCDEESDTRYCKKTRSDFDLLLGVLDSICHLVSRLR